MKKKELQAELLKAQGDISSLIERLDEQCKVQRLQDKKIAALAKSCDKVDAIRKSLNGLIEAVAVIENDMNDVRSAFRLDFAADIRRMIAIDHSWITSRLNELDGKIQFITSYLSNSDSGILQELSAALSDPDTQMGGLLVNAINDVLALRNEPNKEWLRKVKGEGELNG